jgi:hypothetical protein
MRQKLDPRTRATVNRRASGGHGTHGDRRTKRQRTRASQRRNAISEQR